MRLAKHDLNRGNIDPCQTNNLLTSHYETTRTSARSYFSLLVIDMSMTSSPTEVKTNDMPGRSRGVSVWWNSVESETYDLNCL